jgi:hypothetical protein
MAEVWLKGVDARLEQVGGLFDAAGAKKDVGQPPGRGADERQ